MADLILNLVSLKSKADAAGHTTTATSSYPSLCPQYNAIVGYVTNGSSVVTINGSYSSNLLVKDVDVILGSLLDNPIIVSGNSLIYKGDVQNLVSVNSKPSGSTVYFKVGDNGTWSTSIPTSTNSGTWPKIYWYATSTTSYKAKYSLASPGLTSASMDKASRSLSWTVTKSNLEYGESGTISASPSDGLGDGTISYSSSNTSIAYISGNTIYAGSGSSTTGSTCTITATISAGTNWESASCTYTIKCYNKYNGTPPINLDLPSGTVWSSYGVNTSGRVNPWTYPMYTKYGRTDDYSSSLSNYTGTENPLNYSYDAARKYLGGSWHIPTKALWDELIQSTTRTWTTMNSSGTLGGSGGIYGMKFENKKDSSKWIFIPACGYYNLYGNLDGPRGTNDGLGRYWASTPTGSKAYNLYFNAEECVTYDLDIYCGLGIWACSG